MSERHLWQGVQVCSSLPDGITDAFGALQHHARHPVSFLRNVSAEEEGSAKKVPPGRYLQGACGCNTCARAFCSAGSAII